MIKYSISPNGYLIYINDANPKKPIRVWQEDIEAIASVCGIFKIDSALLGNDYNYRVLKAALTSLKAIKKQTDAKKPYESESQDEQDDYVDLLTAIDDLTGIIRRIDEVS